MKLRSLFRRGSRQRARGPLDELLHELEAELAAESEMAAAGQLEPDGASDLRSGRPSLVMVAVPDSALLETLDGDAAVARRRLAKNVDVARESLRLTQVVSASATAATDALRDHGVPTAALPGAIDALAVCGAADAELAARCQPPVVRGHDGAVAMVDAWRSAARLAPPGGASRRVLLDGAVTIVSLARATPEPWALLPLLETTALPDNVPQSHDDDSEPLRHASASATRTRGGRGRRAEIDALLGSARTALQTGDPVIIGISLRNDILAETLVTLARAGGITDQPRWLRIAYSDASEGPPFPVGWLPAAAHVTPGRVPHPTLLPPAGWPAPIHCGLLSSRHLDLDHEVAIYLLRNREISVTERALGASDLVATRRVLALLTGRETDMGRKQPIHAVWHMSGFAPAVVAAWRALVLHVCHRDDGLETGALPDSEVTDAVPTLVVPRYWLGSKGQLVPVDGAPWVAGIEVEVDPSWRAPRPEHAHELRQQGRRSARGTGGGST